MQKKALQILIGTLLSTIYFVLFTTPVQAATIPLDGYAWSENIGWIQFKNTGAINYGVLVDTSNGNFSGYAWSENLGWLSFDVSDTASCGSRANLNTQTGVVTGWAKFLINGECVKLDPASGVTYNNNNNKFSGFAWGGEITGWIKWQHNNPSYYVESLSPIVAPPAAPTNLTPTPVSQTQINLAWTDNASGETGFQIERKTGAGGTYALIQTTNPNVDVYENTGLTVGTLYYYRVRAINNGGESIWNETSTTTLPYTATITVDVTPNNATWTINPGNIVRTGDAAVTVNPSGGGTMYTITPGSPPSGYDADPTVTNSKTGTGTTMTLFDANSESFTVIYNQSTVICIFSCNGPGGSGEGGSTSTDGPEDVDITKGGSPQSDTTSVTLNLSGGPTQPVAFSFSGSVLAPNVVTVSASPNPCSPTCTSTITVTAYPNAPVGTHTLTVTATPQNSGSPVSATFDVTIREAIELSAVCVHSPNSALVGEAVTWTATPSLGTPPYTFQYWTGDLPDGAIDTDYPLTGTYSTTGSKTVIGRYKDSKDVVAICPANPINIGVDPDFGEF